MDFLIMKFLYYVLPILLVLGVSYAFFFNAKSIDISDLSKSFYDYSAISIDGDTIPMEIYKDKKYPVISPFDLKEDDYLYLIKE